MTKRPTKAKKPENVFPPRALTTEEKNERNNRMDQGQEKIGLFIIARHLQQFIKNRSLQAALKEHDLLVSWDDEKETVAVETIARRPEKSKKRYESRPTTPSN